MKTISAIFDHCEPVQEILGSVPSWITRWGVTIIFAVFAMIILGCCLIDYPHIISAPITVVVSDDGEVTGNMFVPSPGFGKVQIGQTVKVKLDCYPYIEYGVLMGAISNFQAIPLHSPQNELVYPTSVSFPSGIDIGSATIPFGQIKEMSGKAEIIVHKRKLIEHFIPINRLIRCR